MGTSRSKRALALAILVGLISTPIRAAGPGPVTTSLFVPIGGCIDVQGTDGNPVDHVCLNGDVHFVTHVTMNDAGAVTEANIYADLVRVAGTSETTQLKYLGVGAGVVRFVPPNPTVPPNPIIPNLTFTFALVRLGDRSLPVPPPIKEGLAAYFSGFALDGSGQLAAVSASFSQLPCGDICSTP